MPDPCSALLHWWVIERSWEDLRKSPGNSRGFVLLGNFGTDQPPPAEPPLPEEPPLPLDPPPCPPEPPVF
jgi:hypothetical protein